MKWHALVDSQIRKAQLSGQLDNLPGAGKPLAPQPAGGTEAVGFRIMADAGVIPREIQLKKSVAAQRLTLQQTTDPDARKAEMQKLTDLELRLAIEQEARQKYYRLS